MGGWRCGWLLLLLLPLLASAACGDDAGDVRVDLRTDYRPGAAFDSVQVRIRAEGGPEVLDESSVAAAEGDDFLSGLLVASFEGRGPGGYDLEATLLLAGASVADSRARVIHGSETTVVTIVIGCPGGDACLGGVDLGAGDLGAGDLGGADAGPESDAGADLGTDAGPGGGCAEVVQVTTGIENTCAVTADGALWCWGRNTHGQLGQGVAEEPGSSVPLRVGADSDWASVAAGDNHVCAIRTDGSLWCWGHNDDGQLGQGDTMERSVPTQVGSRTDWAFVDSLEDHNCALDEAGMAWCWGEGDRGQLGTGGLGDRYVPSAIPGGPWAQISVGWEHNCVRTAAGALQCWGGNTYGELGDGTTLDRPTPQSVGAGMAWADVAAGTFLTCAITDTGSLWCWGRNSEGQLGIGTRDSLGTAAQPDPQRVGTDDGWTAVVAGDEFAAAQRNAGELWCWGENNDGECGVGSGESRHLSPTRIGSLQQWSGPALGGRQGCALQPEGKLHCWGGNDEGQVGAGDFVDRLVPTGICVE